ncbi:RsiV family protein, partial [Bacillus pumilus]|uniref:RsiV family protein n=1 Tax=Bacillus pumilus TaxID=1408 RepID=UPI0021B4AA6D
MPTLFKHDRYIHVITENIKQQINKHMKEHSNKIYCITKQHMLHPFKNIQPDQTFYINGKPKLLISFNQY